MTEIRTPEELEALVNTAARKIVAWGIDEARERDAFHQEASSIGIDRDFDDAAIDALAERIEAAVAAIVRPDALAAAVPTTTTEWGVTHPNHEEPRHIRRTQDRAIREAMALNGVCETNAYRVVSRTVTPWREEEGR